MGKTALALLRWSPFAAVALLWMWVADAHFPPIGNALCICGGVAGIFPAVFLARAALDRRPTETGALWITSLLHAYLMAAFGAALIKALQTHASWRLVAIPLPQDIAAALVTITGTFAFLVVLNLALRGLGAPFALALSRRLATGWLYRWTRNPMVLATVLWLFAVGLWLQSAGFLAWLLLLALPAELTFVKCYEERELAIRFGDDYRAYKAKTPFLWPRRPQD
jgi:protein-S-isoprenylcysteine O-methyltransferase Ste14